MSAAGEGSRRLPAPPSLRRSRSEREFEVGEAPLEAVELTVPKNPTVHVDTSRIQDMTFGITTATQFRALDPAEVDGKDVPIPVGERATFRISMREDDELLVRFVETSGPGASLVLDGPPQMHVRARFVGPDGKPAPGELRLQRELGSFQLEHGGAGDDATPTADVATRMTGTLAWIAVPKDAALAQVHGDVVVTSGKDTDLGEIRFAARIRGGDASPIATNALRNRGRRVGMDRGRLVFSAAVPTMCAMTPGRGKLPSKRKTTFLADLIEGHKGVTVVLVPFDPEIAWGQPPVRLAGRRHGWPVQGTLDGTRFSGYVGDRWGRFFVIVEPALRAKAGVAVGDVVTMVIEPSRTAAAIAIAIEQSKATTQPKVARSDAIGP